jgi:hypothetical protein
VGYCIVVCSRLLCSRSHWLLRSVIYGKDLDKKSSADDFILVIRALGNIMLYTRWSKGL